MQGQLEMRKGLGEHIGMIEVCLNVAKLNRFLCNETADIVVANIDLLDGVVRGAILGDRHSGFVIDGYLRWARGT